MPEKIFTLQNIEPAQIFGSHDVYFKIIKKQFPKLKLTARGEEILGIGIQTELDSFGNKIDLLKSYLRKSHKIDKFILEEIFSRKENFDIDNVPDLINGSDILFYGNNGKVIRPKTVNHKKIVKAIQKNDIVFAVGPAGSGKTYMAMALAVKALKDKQIKKIILSRPAVEAGESLGFLPGDMKEKIDPYLRPLYDALEDMLPAAKLEKLLENKTIEIAPMAFMRGRTLDNCFVILDEAQNTTHMQIKMFLTRMGPNAKIIITGDITQIDLPRNQKSGLVKAINILKAIKGLSIIQLGIQDVVRHKLVKAIINAYEKDTDNNKYER